MTEIPPKPTKRGREGLVLIGFCLFLFFRELTTVDLWASHEARAAQNAQSLIDSGQWMLPHLFDGTPEYQKPPGYYWLVALLGLINGSQVAIWCVRFPAALAALGTVFLLWNYLRNRLTPPAALLIALILATSVHFTGMARVGRIDMPLTFFVTGLILQFRQNGSYFWGGLWVSLILIFKGPIGLVLVGSVVLACWIFRIPLVSWSRIILTTILGAIPPTLWFVAIHLQTQGEFTQTFFIYHHWQRASGGAEALEKHPLGWYIPLFLSRFLPYSPCVLLVLVRWKKENHLETRFGMVWLVSMFVILSLSRFKRADYLLPAYPGAALILAGPIQRWSDRFLSRSPESQQGFSRKFGWVLTGLFVVSFVGWTLFDRLVTFPKAQTHEVREFARIVRNRVPNGQEVVFFQTENHLLAYHLGAPIRTVVSKDELEQIRPEYLVMPEGVFVELATKWPLERITGTQDFLNVRAYHPVVLARGKWE